MGIPDDFMAREVRRSRLSEKLVVRLKQLADFPRALARQIRTAPRGTYKLDLPPQQIHIIEFESVELLRERLP
jgi:hypothetical protein